MRFRPSHRAVSLALAIGLAVAGVGALGGCSLARNVVEGATGGKVDIGGASVPSTFPKDAVPLVTGDVVYGASLKTEEGQGWNVTIKVSGLDAYDGISTQLTGAGFTAGQSGRDDLGATGTFAKDPYAVVVLVSKPDAKTGWTVNYTVTKSTPTASPTPTPTK
jgi:hypothetical protein